MSLNTDSPDAKKPCKGILKSSSSFDKHTTAPVASSSNHRKSAKFDELNVLQTYHPADKDYGHMKVDEPKTPFNYVEELDLDQLDAELLAEKLREAVNSRSDSVSEEEAESSEEEEEELSEEQKKRKLDFERRRKAHYNEFEAIKLARKLIEEEHEDDDDDDEDDASLAQAAAAAAVNSSSKSSDGQKMEVEEHDEVDRKKDEPAAGSSRSAATTTTEARRPIMACVNPYYEFGSLTDSIAVAPSRRVSRKSVISSILIISAVLTLVSMFCLGILYILF